MNGSRGAQAENVGGRSLPSGQACREAVYGLPSVVQGTFGGFVSLPGRRPSAAL